MRVTHVGRFIFVFAVCLLPERYRVCRKKVKSFILGVLVQTHGWLCSRDLSYISMDLPESMYTRAYNPLWVTSFVSERACNSNVFDPQA